jgi:hypothetical protein
VGRVIAWLLEKVAFQLAIKAFFLTIVASIGLAYATVIFWAISMIGEVFSWVQSILDLISIGTGVMPNVYGLLECMGFWDGYNAGSPFLYMALTAMFLYNLHFIFAKFSTTVFKMTSEVYKVFK